jgi:predicted nuclease of predicted toxin-antitoxin system
VNFLVDANLPPRLCDWLRQRGHSASHLIERNALRTPDKTIWQWAAAQQQVLLTKDTDFYERSLLYGKPPQVLLVSVGNCSNDDLFGILATSWLRVEAELSAGSQLVVLYRDRLEVHP